MRRLTKISIRSNHRGDTIIEVLIAIGIVSLVLTSAYVTTNRNAQVSQKIQEQGQAQKLAERQIELLRGFNGTVPPDGGCLVATGGVASLVSGEACQNLAAASSGASYTLSIKPIAADTYKVSADWDALGGQTANVTMYYRR